jgi:hypothetical protein
VKMSEAVYEIFQRKQLTMKVMIYYIVHQRKLKGGLLFKIRPNVLYQVVVLM